MRGRVGCRHPAVGGSIESVIEIGRGCFGAPGIGHNRKRGDRE